MKKNRIITSFLMLFLSLNVMAQNNNITALGLPGDNLNLYAVLDQFQKSPTLEEFEQIINDRSNNINNLDLNYDNQVDYISVHSYQDGRDYSIVLRTAVNSSQMQDIATIEVNKVNNGNVIIQLIGNEDLYGNDYIIEPGDYNSNARTTNPGYGQYDNSYNNYSYGTTPYYVNRWPLIVYLFSPRYVNYYSPWSWGYYPRYWNPWSPIYYSNYWSFHRHYYNGNRFYRCNRLRMPIHNAYHNNHRQRSSIVHNNQRNGKYRSTYNGVSYNKPKEQIRTVTKIDRNIDRVSNNSNTSIRSNERITHDEDRQKNIINTQRDASHRKLESVDRNVSPVVSPRNTSTRMEQPVRTTRENVTPRSTPTRMEQPVRTTRENVTPRSTPNQVERVQRQSAPTQNLPKEGRSINRGR